jgi:hypothetical protein
VATNRRPNPRLAKIHRSYSVEEIARLFKIHKNTVRNWFKQGLNAIDGQRPILIRGQDLQRFLTERRSHAKQACGPGRIYCLPCRAPKVPAGNMAECVAVGDTIGTLHGICPDCNRMIYRRVNPQKLNDVRGNLEVTVTLARARIIAARPRNDGLVFAPMTSWSRRKLRLDAAITERLGKPLAPWTLHDLRRSAATGMADIGIQPHIVEAVLNHISGSKRGVAGIYNRSTYAPEKKDALNKWADRVQDIVAGKPSNVTPIRERV